MRVLAVLALLLVAGCSLSLGAEKLNLDAKTAKTSKPVTQSPTVTAVRGDRHYRSRVFV